MAKRPNYIVHHSSEHMGPFPLRHCETFEQAQEKVLEVFGLPSTGRSEMRMTITRTSDGRVTLYEYVPGHFFKVTDDALSSSPSTHVAPLGSSLSVKDSVGELAFNKAMESVQEG